ncbi:hypothetical protein [Pseudoclavibacter sp. VKM Ac-2888]|uniref:hypothetical protein n=1 Tax=Pseudoclavibacter sp. VKM Ac-2888 TaxID=2783830 RepID=UPI00188CD89C|nr:hypothetical protein [Pseudoclavibacter sp. VKM Ac-2888]MBF4550413.1 hypothetical protein [Pseudoclavibacter sp. VKM Ac-2888]
MRSQAEIPEAVGAKMRARLQETLARCAELLGGGADARAESSENAGAAASTGASTAAPTHPAPEPTSGAAESIGEASRHEWVAPPMHSDAAIRAQTGQGWDDWIDAIDAGVGRDAAHPRIVEWVMANSAQNGWWSQGIAVSFERMTGRRLAGQMPDGTFTANRSRTLPVDREVLRALIADDAARDALLGFETEFRSKVASKTYKVLIARDAQPFGGLLFTFDAAPNGRTKLAIAHEKLQVVDEIELWKAHWGAWLDALELALS